MINITNIGAGWLTLTIGDKSFGVSYLTNVKSELDEFLNLPLTTAFLNPTIKLLYFDGEGRELYLTIRRQYDDLIIIWEEFSESEYLYRMEFPYDDFIHEWLTVWDRIKDDYYKHFDLDTWLDK